MRGRGLRLRIRWGWEVEGRECFGTCFAYERGGMGLGPIVNTPVWVLLGGGVSGALGGGNGRYPYSVWTTELSLLGKGLMVSFQGMPFFRFRA